jgi:hypothetical protein
VPLPYGGMQRQINVDLVPQALLARGLSAADVSTALNAQNLILPVGSAKMGEREYTVQLNSSPDVANAINDLPIKQVNGAMVYMVCPRIVSTDLNVLCCKAEEAVPVHLAKPFLADRHHG